MMKFDHAALQVQNMDRAIAFYTEKLGFTLNNRAINQEEQEEYAFISAGNVRIELIQDLTNDYTLPILKKPFCPHLCVEVEDLEVAVRDLEAMEIPILRGPLEIENEETWVYFSDPDHNVLEFIQWYNKK
ncbi:VOC family protein [Mucilaginibacter paludis]|uniref:Glyoxalase/bleomycin resistance protein/dioxygenase n=1 Tax=Mucilaginibacter paludis DSM 18603 TaxID=714943 RepID=H1Y479_9SPHI|nr:VOC family protein [Mucilaginibacter paludis]EHQ24815.1 Glyoxalase/bleomycin resistance protein/dioxygenase [Mucilaginibacter paludis DSM 18603]